MLENHPYQLLVLLSPFFFVDNLKIHDSKIFVPSDPQKQLFENKAHIY